MQDFFNPYQEIDSHGSSLPHWQQGSAFVFVTWRLADSLPAEKLQEWQAERKIWLEKHPLPWDSAVWDSYNELFPERMEAWLDRGVGSCVLLKSDVRQVVEGAFHFFDGVRYRINDYVIMPNHVHLLFQPMEGYLIKDILHSWKSYTSKEIQKLTGETGTLWQRGYWDRLMRSRAHFERCARYIRENPEKAKLSTGQYSVFSCVGDRP